MRRSIIILALCSLFFAPLMAQEAFYIYRNDGDFNGFFYDEVKEMRYSKLALDSVEYEQYVTYEVVLADTTYRIPLAAIDSIGFQQPEIIFKPRVKFVEREGLSPYIHQVTGSGIEFANLPSNLTPQVGDVLIGFPSDAIAKEKYTYVGGSFSCVVAQVEDKGNGHLVVSGQPVSQLSEVFEQFITVEEVGLDKQGNVIRRIAGCTPDGFPRKAPTATKEKVLDLINISSTLTRSWEPADNCNIDLSADVSMIVRLRAAYNISGWRFTASLSQEFLFPKVKPSLGLSYSRGFELEAEDLLPVPIGEIVFPAACPIFAVNPVPCLFVRGEGKAEARLNMPAVKMGIGMRYTYDTGAPFPISCNLLLSEGKEEELTEEMLDLSGELSLSGFVQAGIKFSGDIFTASWLKRVLSSSIGVYLYVGPKVGGTLSLAKADMSGGGLSLYNSLASSNLNLALLSLDLEAKAKVSLFWQEEKEKTFYSKNWSFFTDSVFMAPSFDQPRVYYANDTMHVTIPSQQHGCLGYQRVAAEVKHGNGKEDTESYVAYTTNEIPYNRNQESFEYTIPLASLRATTYEVYPLVRTWSFAPMETEPKQSVAIPPVIKLSNDSLIFGATTNLTQTIEVTSNVVGADYISGHGGDTQEEVIDSSAGKYRYTITLPPNDRLFDRRFSKECQMYYISARCANDTLHTMVPFAVCQQANNLQGFTFSFSIHSDACSNMYFNYDYPVTATRVGDNKIHVIGHHVDGDYTYNVDVYLTRLADIEGYSVDSYSASGTVSKTHKYTYYGGDREDPCTGTATETWTATIIPRANDTSVGTVKGTYDNRGSGCDAFSSHCEDPNCYWNMSAQVHLP